MPRYTEEEARAAVHTSLSYAEALRKLGLRPAGGNHALFRRYVDEVWQISTEHFDAARAQRSGLTRRRIPLSEVLVEHSSYSRTNLKARLLEEGPEAASLRVVRTGRDLARTSDVADPGSHQRRAG